MSFLRVLWRNAIFVTFPLVVLAIIFLAKISVGSAARFGEWGERSIVDAMVLVAKEKLDRVESVVRSADDVFFAFLGPALLGEACPRWRETLASTRLVEAAAVIDDNDEIVAFFHRSDDEPSAAAAYKLIADEVVPRFEAFEALERYKHLHARVRGERRLVTYITTTFNERDYTTCIVYDNRALIDDVIAPLLQSVGQDRVANIVDENGRPLFGGYIEGAGQFIVALQFPATMYKWRLQLAATGEALFAPPVPAQRFFLAMLAPSAFGVIVLGVVMLYFAVMRERRLNRLQAEFIANVTHELKTPLSLIRMFGEMLLLGKVTDPDKTRRYHEVILRESDRLTALIDNVLNLARIERGKGAYEFQLQDVTEAVARAVDIYRPRTEKDGPELCFTSAAPGTCGARIDEQALVLAVLNLIDNAFKYAEGTDVVGVCVERRQNEVLIAVYDHGIGISSGQLRHVFERFYRVPSKATREHRGSGIGLSIVRHIVRAHSGRIDVQSASRAETRFTIRLPAVSLPASA